MFFQLQLQTFVSSIVLFALISINWVPIYYLLDFLSRRLHYNQQQTLQCIQLSSSHRIISRFDSLLSCRISIFTLPKSYFYIINMYICANPSALNVMHFSFPTTVVNVSHSPYNSITLPSTTCHPQQQQLQLPILITITNHQQILFCVPIYYIFVTI